MRFPWSTARRKQDIQEEIDSHLRMAIADRVARGETQQEARQAAIREFGNKPLVEEVTRETWGWLWLERLGQDFRYALRQMRRAPGFAVSVIATLALGIGAATAMFTVVDHVLLRPLPYRDADRLMLIQQRDGAKNFSISRTVLSQWIAQSHSLDQIAFWTGMSGRNFLVEKNSRCRSTVRRLVPIFSRCWAQNRRLDPASSPSRRAWRQGRTPARSC